MKSIATRFITVIGAFVLSSLVISHDACAASTGEVATQWGLIGTWAVDCSVSADKGIRTRLSYEVRNGQAVHRRNFGDDTSADVIRSIKINPDNSLEIQMFFKEVKAGEKNRRFVMIKDGNGKIRAMSNMSLDNQKYSVRDGKFTANGTDTPWQTRCK